MSMGCKLGLFAGGVLFGTAGLKILSSREASTVVKFVTFNGKEKCRSAREG